MSLWLLATPTVVIFVSVITGRRWLILLAIIYASIIISRYLYLAHQGAL